MDFTGALVWARKIQLREPAPHELTPCIGIHAEAPELKGDGPSSECPKRTPRDLHTSTAAMDGFGFNVRQQKGWMVHGESNGDQAMLFVPGGCVGLFSSLAANQMYSWGPFMTPWRAGAVRSKGDAHCEGLRLQRRGWDSNPRKLSLRWFSRPEPSTTRPPLQGVAQASGLWPHNPSAAAVAAESAVGGRGWG